MPDRPSDHRAPRPRRARPRIAWTLGRALAAMVCLLLTTLVGTTTAAPLDTADPGYVTNGPVYATKTVGTTTYVGGTFTEIGPRTGPGVQVSRATGAWASSGVQVQGGVVNAVVDDGSGGWFIGGTFTFVDGVARNRIAHVLPGGALDQTFNPNANSTVSVLLRSGSTLYVGGSFTNIGGLGRNYLAALSTTDGGVTDWNPASNNTVIALALSGTTLYAGGSFTSIGGALRNRIAALDTTVDTSMATAFDANANNVVRAIVVNGTNVYAGGDFTLMGGVARNRLALVDGSTGALDATWNPNANNIVLAMAWDGTNVLAGGSFTNVGGQARNYIAALGATGAGNATGWNPNASTTVRAITVDGTHVFVGGDFATIGGQARDRAADLDVTTGLADVWNPDLGNGVYAIAVDGTNAYLGGTFTTLNTVTRNRIAAIDADTGLPTNWNPNASGSVVAIDVIGTTLYAGGSFGTIGGQSRSNIAALDTTTDTNQATTWNPGANGGINAIVASGTTIYAGGAFTTIGGAARSRIAALDTTTAVNNATTWDPSANNTVSALALDGTTMYVGGSFTTIGGQTRNRVAAINTAVATNNATTWDPNSSGAVTALAIASPVAYVGGTFATIGGKTRANLAAINLGTGVATSWNPNVNNQVNALLVSGSRVYAAGAFTTVGPQTRQYLAELDATINTNVATAWNPNLQSTARALDLTGDGALTVGGDFLSTNLTAQSYVARYSTAVANTVAPSISGTARVGSVLTCAPGTWTGSSPITLAYSWTRDGAAIGGATASTYTLVTADANRVVRCSITAANRASTSTLASPPVTPTPAIPTNSSLPTLTGSPKVGQTIACTEGTWTSSPTSYTRQWLRNGSPIVGETGTGYVVVGADVAQSIRCDVTATNAGGTSTAASSSPVTGLPQPPTVTTAPAITGVAQEGQVATCSDGSWTSSPSSYARTWRRDGTPIGGATSSTYTYVALDAGASITCVVTATNAGGTSDASASAPVIPLPLPPAIVAAPTLGGTVQVGETTTCSAGTWSGTPTGYTYSWELDAAPIGGATTNTYVPVAGDAGHSLRCVVVASNAGGSSGASASGASTVLPSVPQNTVLPAITGSAREGQVLTCSTGTWSNAPTGYTRRWLRAGAAIGGATNATYTLVNADVGASITCEVTASNAGGAGTPATSAGVVPVNLAPGNLTLPSIVGTVQSGRTVTCDAGTWSAAPTSFTRQWRSDGIDIPTATGATFLITDTEVATALTCAVTATNAGGTSGVVVSGGVVVLPMVPVNTSVPVIIGTITEGQTVTCTTGTWTGFPSSHAVRWLRDGTPIPGAISPLYTLTGSDAGRAITCEATATNAGGTSAPAVSGGVVPAPLPPTIASLPTLSGTVQVGRTVVCDTGAWTRNPTSWTRQWRRDGVDIPLATAATYAPVGADIGTALSCAVVASNAGGASSPAASFGSTVLPPAPAIAVAPAITGTAQETQLLTCGTGTWSDSPTSYTYRWLRGGTPIVGALAPVYVLTGSDVGAGIACEVTASNTGGTGEAAVSGAVVPVPLAPSVTLAPSITGLAQVGGTLACDNGSWQRSPTSFARVWKRNGASLGVTTTSYVLVAGDLGASITCEVTATNAGGSSAPVASNAVTVAPAPPTLTASPSVSGTAQDTQVVSCSTGSWTGSPSAYTYRWLRSGTPIGGATSSSYSLTSFDVGQSITCEVTASNAGGSGAPATSGGVVPVPLAPAVVTLPTISGTAQAGRVIGCEAGGWTGSPSSFVRAWRKDGVVIPGEIGVSYLVRAGDVDAQVTCTVTAGNGGGSTSATSDPVVPLPASLPVPVNAVLPSIGGSATTQGTLTCAAGTWLNDPTGYAIAWLRDGLVVAGRTDSTYVLQVADAGTSIGCMVTATNSAGTGSALSQSIRIAGAPPVALAAPAISGNMRIGTQAWCTPPTWDVVPDAVAYQWLRNGVAIGGATNARYVLQRADSGTLVTCRVTGTTAGGSTSVASQGRRAVLADQLTLRILPRSGKDTPVSNLAKLTVPRGSWVTLTGTLYTDSGARAAGLPVVLRALQANGGSRVVGTVITNANGNYRLRVRAAGSSNYRASSPAFAEPRVAAADSRTVVVLVRTGTVR